MQTSQFLVFWSYPHHTNLYTSWRRLLVLQRCAKECYLSIELVQVTQEKSSCIALGSNPSLDWAETCQYSKMDVWKGVGGVWSCLWKATRTAYLSYPLATLLPLDVDIWRGCMMPKARMRQCWGPQGFSPKHERTKLKDWLLTLLMRRWRAAGVCTGAAKVPNSSTVVIVVMMIMISNTIIGIIGGCRQHQDIQLHPNTSDHSDRPDFPTQFSDSPTRMSWSS